MAGGKGGEGGWCEGVVPRGAVIERRVSKRFNPLSPCLPLCLQRDGGGARHLQERERDRKLARDKERQINQPRGGTARVPTGITPKPILENMRRILIVRHPLANIRRDKTIVPALPAHILPADNEILPILQVRVAPRQGVGPRFAKHVLHAVGDEPDARERQRQAEPADVQLPELALPDEGFGGPPGHGVPRYEEDGDDEDEHDRDAAVEEDEEPGGHCLVHCEGEAIHKRRGHVLLLVWKHWR